MPHLHFLRQAGIVFLPPSNSISSQEQAGCTCYWLAVSPERLDFCCDSDILFMATTLVETNRQIDRGLEMFPLCPSKGFPECSLQVGFQPMNRRRMHGLPSLLYSCLSYMGFWFRCPLGWLEISSVSALASWCGIYALFLWHAKKACTSCPSPFPFQGIWLLLASIWSH